MADSPDLMRLLQDKHEAVRAYREAVDEDAKTKAWDGVHAASEALEAELVAREQAREDEARLAAVEAREHAAAKVGTIDSTRAKRMTANPEFRRFVKGETQHFETKIVPESRDEIDWTTAGSGVYGSYTIDSELYNRVQMQLLAQSGVLKAGPTILRTAGGNQINIPLLTAANHPVGVATAEGTAATYVHPVFTTAALNSYKIAGAFGISQELMDDTGVNMNELIGDLAGGALGALVADYLADVAVGTGSTLPNALMIGTTLGKAAAGIDSWTASEARELFYSVLPEYRASGSSCWVANSDFTLEAALWTDDTGNFMWQPSLMAAEPDRMMGRPFYEDSHINASATNLKCAAFGDIKKAFWVRFAHGGMDLSFSRDYAFTSYEITARFGIWLDSQTVDALAMKHILTA